MQKADIMNLPLIAWFVIVSSVDGEIVYLWRETNASVQIPCVCLNNSIKLFAFSLLRGIDGNSSEVLYHNPDCAPSINDEVNGLRIFVQNKLSRHRVTVKITYLQENDTDLYHCVFHHEADNSFLKIPGSTKFFLHVGGDEGCICYSYEPLLYALSAVAVLLFLCVLTVAGVHCKTTSLCQKNPEVQPVYEDMKNMALSNPAETKNILPVTAS